MLEFEKSVGMLKKYGIKFADFEIARKKEQIPKVVKKTGFPVVAKAISPKIIHKTDGGFVVVDIRTEKEAIGAFDGFYRKTKKFDFLLQKQLAGTEVIIGGKVDPQFGPVVLFGLGGIFTEVLKDVSIRVAPLEERDAREMISEIRGRKVLEGARGQKPANMDKLAKTIVAVGKLMANEGIKELDLNPCFVGSDCVAADVRIIK